MRRDFINKIIAGTIISTTLCTLVPIKASAEWVSDYQNNRYYMQDGQKLTGWKKIEGSLYYFDNNGKMLTGWLKAENSNYFLENNGALKIGWFKYDRNWYYSDSNGVMQTGILNISGKVYILNSNGIMQTNNTVINGQFYTIGSDGAVAGATTPTPDKEFDGAGNVLAVLKNTESKGSVSPTYSSFNDVIKDQSVSNDDPNEGRTFKVRFKDSNGAELKVKSIKNGKAVDLYAPTKDGYVFGSWNTKSDGSGKSYESDDDIKVKEDINLYAQWTGDTVTYIDGIIIKGSSYVTVNKTTQMTAEISPSEASSTGVTWSVTDGTGKATIDSNTGVLTGVTAGSVIVKATSKDKSKFSVTKEITVSTIDIKVPVNKISIGSKTGVFAITASGGTLQMTANVYPDNANNQDVTWSVENIGGSASIDPATGLVTAISDGVVTVKATAKDKSGVSGSTTIKISGQSVKIPLTSIEISGKNGANTIATDVAEGGTNGTLQISANILPATASSKSLTWSIVGGDKDVASINSSTGLLTAIANGTVVVQATANETGIVSNKLSIAITGQTIKLTGIYIAGAASISGNTDFNVVTTPAGAAIKDVKWVVENQTGSAALANDTGITTTLKPQSNGNVILKAIATAKDGSIITDTQDVQITGQDSVVILITSISKVYGTDAGGKTVTSIIKDDGTLQMHADILPSYATTTSSAVKWTVIGSGATIDPNTGILKAVSNGRVTVRATSKTDAKIYKDGSIYVSGQITQATGINISPIDGTTVAVGATLQMSANVNPTEATYSNVTWQVESGTGTADIDKTTGVLIGRSVGDVTVVAIADNGVGMTETRTITVIPPVKVVDITINPSSGSITSPGGTLPMSVMFNPTNATNQGVTWSVVQAGSGDANFTGKATISADGILTASGNGNVKVKATSKENSQKVSESIINISGQTVKATSLLVTAATNIITVDDATLEMVAGVIPGDATTTPASVTWSVEPYSAGPLKLSGSAEITPVSTAYGTNATLKAVSNGDVKVKATGKATDGTTINGEYIVSLSNQVLLPTEITINKPSTSIVVGTQVKLTATITPTNATIKKVKWEIVSGGTGTAVIGTTDGSLMGMTSGVILIKVSVVDEAGTTIYATTTTPLYIS